MLLTICDLTIANKISLGFFSVNLQTSSIGAIVYILSFLVTMRINDFKIIFSEKSDTYIIITLGFLLVVAFISSSLSVMSKISVTATVSRYAVYFLVFICTIGYSKISKEASGFIIKSFIYFNILIMISCILDFFVPAFDSLLIEHFGHMLRRHSTLKIWGIHFLRPQGFITDTNLSALSISLSFVFLLLNSAKFRYKYFLYVFYICAGIVTGMQASRSAEIFIVAFAVAAFLGKWVDRKKLIAAFSIFIAAQLLTPQTQARIFQIADVTGHEEEITYGRPLIWKACFIAFEKSPVIGIGSNVFIYQSLELITTAYKESNENNVNFRIEDPINPQNVFLTMLVEYGVIGFILNLVFLYLLYRKLMLKRCKKCVLLVSALVFVSTFANYAPYYKYYIIICIILYVNINNSLNIENNTKQND